MQRGKGNEAGGGQTEKREGGLLSCIPSYRARFLRSAVRVRRENRRTTSTHGELPSISIFPPPPPECLCMCASNTHALYLVSHRAVNSVVLTPYLPCTQCGLVQHQHQHENGIFIHALYRKHILAGITRLYSPNNVLLPS